MTSGEKSGSPFFEFLVYSMIFFSFRFNRFRIKNFQTHFFDFGAAEPFTCRGVFQIPYLFKTASMIINLRKLLKIISNSSFTPCFYSSYDIFLLHREKQVYSCRHQIFSRSFLWIFVFQKLSIKFFLIL